MLLSECCGDLWVDYAASHMFSQQLQDGDSCDFLNPTYGNRCQAGLITAGAISFRNEMMRLTQSSLKKKPDMFYDQGCYLESG